MFNKILTKKGFVHFPLGKRFLQKKMLFHSWSLVEFCLCVNVMLIYVNIKRQCFGHSVISAFILSLQVLML